jgi:hypothetical protein
VYIDDADDDFSAISIDSSLQPFVFRHTLDMSSKTIGQQYKVYVKAYTSADQVDSQIISFLYDTVPTQPATPTAVSDEEKMIVTLTPPGTGQEILAYELEFDYNNGNGFSLLKHSTWYSKESGPLLSTLFNIQIPTPEVKQGERYRARYRLMNIIGWSEWSKIGYLLMATVPPAPPMPTFISATDQSVQIGIALPGKDNGSPIDLLKIYRDTGDYASDVDTSVEDVSTDTIQKNVTSLLAGKIYRFGVKAHNEIGDSLISQFGIYAAATDPDAPANVTKNLQYSQKSAIRLCWNRVSDTEIPVTGYELSVIKLSSYFKYNDNERKTWLPRINGLNLVQWKPAQQQLTDIPTTFRFRIDDDV